ncbi:MAG: hypothetical protein JNK85_11235 [Verrucomicrobiales bacterium]|nr:hypothetical protein [Verrucomicrobiales bacterium]
MTSLRSLTCQNASRRSSWPRLLGFLPTGLAATVSVSELPAAAQQASSVQSVPASGLVAEGEPQTSYLESTIPALPWLPADAPVLPEWGRYPSGGSPFLSPGLGTTSIGASSLPSALPPARDAGEFRPLPVGPFDLRGGLGYELLYGDGILSGPGREEATWQNSITPSVTLYAGDHWTIGYSPSIRFYSADGYENTVNHSATLGWNTTFRNWRFQLFHATAITSDPLVETGQQTDQTSHSTSLNGTLDRGTRGSWTTSIAQTIRLTDIANDRYSWNWNNAYDIPWSQKLKYGVGLVVGYDMLNPGSDMVNQQFTARMNGILSPKLSYSLSAGADVREFVNSDADIALSPIVSCNIGYQILQKTALSIGFSRDSGTSYLSDQYTENMSVQGAVTQILTERWSLSASGGYRFSSYSSILANGATTREDGTAFATISLGARLLDRLSSSIYYSYRSNSSDADGLSFDSNQFGLSLNYAF